MASSTILDARFSEALTKLPANLASGVNKVWAAFTDAWAAQGAQADLNLLAPSLPALCRVWACSQFVADACVRTPQLLYDLCQSNDLQAVYQPDQLRRQLQQQLQACESEQQLSRLLRLFRRREMVRIAWRDIAGDADLAETLRDLSMLAEVCIDEALQLLSRWHKKEYGIPLGQASGTEQTLVVLGMGKLGAGELNFSSDIDLIFAYPEAGETRDGPRVLSNEQYFTALGRRLIKVLDASTEYGFVFRVDMRLRPYGDSGPLVMNFDGMEVYYQSQGRDWERYALIKARPVAGDHSQGQLLLKILRPFIYRRYLDYGTFENLRDMKAMINREVKSKGLQQNIKLGPGGIREIEFIGQLFQLIRGGREKVLQRREIMVILSSLQELGHLPSYVVADLQQDYIFLRRLENRIQAYADEQTHKLPAEQELAAWQRLALAMDYVEVSDFRQQLNKVRRRVQGHFEQVFTAPQAEEAPEESKSELHLAELWQHLDDERVINEMSMFRDPAEALRCLRLFRDSAVCRSLSARGHDRLNRLMPLLLSAISDSPDADNVLLRVLTLIEAIARRTAYLALLIENPMALSQLVHLCAASPWIAEQLAGHPILLDELLDPRSLYAPPDRQGLQQELAQLMLESDDHDLERQMDLLRQFKQSQVLRVAAADLADAIPLMVVSDHLSHIAEVILEQILPIAARAVARDITAEDLLSGFAVIAYGKLGGLELGYGSDLDLVFLHNGDAARSVMYARLGQRIIHILTALTPAGVLYDVDMRLRPSGASGLLVSSMAAFTAYQRQSAWTWEHQALIRARFIAGAASIAEDFNRVRHDILAQPRAEAALRQDVRDMRLRMRGELLRQQDGMIDIKQIPGGLADIEFLVQYAVLRWAHEHNALLQWTDNVRLLQTLASENLITDPQARLLVDAYITYRGSIHRSALQQQPAMVPTDEFAEYRAQIGHIWQQIIGNNEPIA